MNKSEFKRITCSGTAHAIGLAHGREAREQIGVSIATYRDMFRVYAKLEWEQALAEAKKYIPFIEAYDPALLEEIEGVAEGSGYPLLEIVALNARSEIALTEKMLDGCTSFALTPEVTGGKTYVGQNWDWKGSQRKSFVVLDIQAKDRPAICMVTEAGIIGKIGFNSAGIGVCLNALVANENIPGTPLHIILRGILHSEILSDAVKAVASTQIASAANFLVCHKDGEAIDIEAAPSDYDVLSPEHGLLVHTNHFTSLRLSGIKDLGKFAFVDSHIRLARARKLYEGKRGQIDLGTIQAVMRDHFNHPKSICRHEDPREDAGRRSESVFSIIMDLNAKTMHLTDGPPCQAEYAVIPASF
jgi:isopenicillin-N N-acyltransferase-like protein